MAYMDDPDYTDAVGFTSVLQLVLWNFFDVVFLTKIKNKKYVCVCVCVCVKTVGVDTYTYVETVILFYIMFFI